MLRNTIALAALLALSCGPLHARVTKIISDATVSLAFCKGTACASYGDIGQYEQISGRAFGELDPRDPHNRIIQDIDLARDADGRAELVATTGQLTFPQVLVDGRSIGGFRELLEADREGRLERLLAR